MSKREQILDEAQRLVQQRGFNGFSYQDLARLVGIKTASIHYHFPSKVDLGVAVMERYHEQFMVALDQITKMTPDSRVALGHYAELFARTLATDGRLCLCGMLAAEAPGLDPAIQAAVRRFFDANHRWLTQILRSGQKAGELSFTRSTSLVASSLFAALEGAMLTARTLNKPQIIPEILAIFIDAIT